jgi:hypothetical protein
VLRLIAHQGGWDEAAVVVLPLVVIGVLGFITNRRRNRAPRD